MYNWTNEPEPGMLLLVVMILAVLFVSVRCGRIASRRPYAALSVLRASSQDRGIAGEVSTIPVGLKEHVRGLIRSSLDSWENSPLTAEELTRIEGNVFTYLASSQESSQSNKKFLDSAIRVTKALKALRSSDYVKTNSMLLGSKGSFNEEMALVLRMHAAHVDTNRLMFNHINNHHQTLALKGATFEEEIMNQSALKTYGEAALKMGDKEWVIDSQRWLEKYTISFFRGGMARRVYLKSTSPQRFGDKELPDRLEKDMFSNKKRIRILDIGSCYNPFATCDNASLFDVTAVDLYPMHPSVFTCNFLDVEVGPKGSAPVIETQGNVSRCIQLPEGYFDAAVMSLVLSYLPTAEQRLSMIRKAQRLLVLPDETSMTRPHFAGLLLIVEKESIFKLSNTLAAPGVSKDSATEGALLQDWKEAISCAGFNLLKYNNMRVVDGRKFHAFAFKTTNSQNETAKSLWIRQDFVTYPTPYKVLNKEHNFVGIIGGGLGGMAMGLSLEKRGVPYKIFEKDVAFDARKQGYALTMQQGTHAMRLLGLDDELKKVGVTSRKHISFDRNGDIIGEYGGGLRKDQEVDKGKHNVHIPRQKLREMLVNNIDESNIYWNKKMVAFEDCTNGADEIVALHFEDGSTFKCNLLIASDGIHSTVYKQLFRESTSSRTLNHLNLLVILGISPIVIDPSNVNNVFVGSSEDASFIREKSKGYMSKRQQMQWVDGRTRVFTMPFDESHTMWQLSFPMDEKACEDIFRSNSDLKNLALQTCHGWHRPLVKLLDATSLESISGHAVYDKDPIDFPLQSRIRNPFSRVTFIGDAAHPMSPFKGQGANQALMDALSLAKHIANSDIVSPQKPSVYESLTNYEREMTSRARIKVMKSRDAAVYLHQYTALNKGNITRAMAAEFPDLSNFA